MEINREVGDHKGESMALRKLVKISRDQGHNDLARKYEDERKKAWKKSQG